MYYFYWFFFVYAFLGWCTEVSYAALVTGKFVNRGFLNGPVCPIYGFGVIIVLSCLAPIKENLLILFLGSVALTSILEWLTGFVLEKIFHQRWWDYSQERFNLGGYICLRFSLAWGLACMLVVKVLHPTIFMLIEAIPHTIGWAVLTVMGIVMAVDLASTVRAICKINVRLQQIDEMAAKIREASNEFGEGLADRVLDAAEKGADWREDMDEFVDAFAQHSQSMQAHLSERRDDLDDTLEQLHSHIHQELKQRKQVLHAQLDEWKNSLERLMDTNTLSQRRLLHAFPKMRSIDHRQALERLRRRIEQSMEKQAK